jgi:hypothetical protein
MRNRKNTNTLMIVLALAGAGMSAVPSLGLAQEEAIFNGEEQLSNPELDKHRGAYLGDSGLKVSLGIEREISVNGAVVMTQKMSVPDLLGLSAMGAPAQLSGAALGVVQNGPGNTFIAPTTGGQNFGTVIQNTLDNQVLQGVTRINASVTNLDLVRSMNLSSSISQEQGRAAR